jgi:hypothetical protein
MKKKDRDSVTSQYAQRSLFDWSGMNRHWKNRLCAAGRNLAVNMIQVIRKMMIPCATTARSLLAVASTGVMPQIAASAQPNTQVGEKLEMQCGEHRVVLTCGHSDAIATRQKTYPRLCNDNTVDFIAKDGSKKTFTTFSKGQHRDKTPMEVECEKLVPINIFRIRVWTNDTAWSFATLLSEDGTRLTDDNGTRMKSKVFPEYRYRIDFNEFKTLGKIQIKESK